MPIRLNGSTSGYTEINNSAVGTNNTITLPGANPTTNGSFLLGATSGQLSFSTDPTLTSLNGGPLAGTRNRIINGDMRIDQRNAGASVTPSTLYSTYTLDRWNTIYSVGSKFSVQQNAGSVTPPSGFQNYLGVTSLSSYTPGTSETFQLLQSIEGYNVSDLNWGASGATSVVLSFWVRTSLTGTFGLSLLNNGNTRSYTVGYTVNAANTWEYKTIIVPGDTAGTWNKTNSAGIAVQFSLGASSSSLGTNGAWSGSGLFGVTGQNTIVGTNGATFYITGVQLEPGSTATPFERRSYGQELALCQRYFFAGRLFIPPTGSLQNVPLPVSMRTTMNFAVILGGGAGFSIADGGAANCLIAAQTIGSGQNMTVSTEL